MSRPAGINTNFRIPQTASIDEIESALAPEATEQDTAMTESEAAVKKSQTLETDLPRPPTFHIDQNSPLYPLEPSQQQVWSLSRDSQEASSPLAANSATNTLHEDNRLERFRGGLEQQVYQQQ